MRITRPGFTWTDGTPTGAASNSTTGIYISGQNNGFQIMATADTALRTLKVYVGAWRTQGQFQAHLSDGSAVDLYMDTSLSNAAGVTTAGCVYPDLQCGHKRADVDRDLHREHEFR